MGTPASSGLGVSPARPAAPVLPKAPVVIDQSDMYTNVFSRFADRHTKDSDVGMLTLVFDCFGVINIQEALSDASKEVGLEVSPEKTKYMLMSRSQKTGHKHSIKIANRSSEDVAKFKYLRTTLTEQNWMHEDINSRLNLGTACYHSVQSLLPFCLLSRNLKVKIYKTIILPVVLYGCGTWPITLREEHRLRVFENRVLRRIFGPRRDEVTGEWRKLHNGELHNLYS
jgi:hypothetical protein